MEEEISCLIIKPKRAFELLGVSRSIGYALLKSGEIKSIRIGKAIKIPLWALEEWLEKKLAEQGTSRGEQE